MGTSGAAVSSRSRKIRACSRPYVASARTWMIIGSRSRLAASRTLRTFATWSGFFRSTRDAPKWSLSPLKRPLRAQRSNSASAYASSGLKLQNATSRRGKRWTCSAVQSFSARTVSSFASASAWPSLGESKKYESESTTARSMPASSRNEISSAAVSGSSIVGPGNIGVSAAIRHWPSARRSTARRK